MAKANRSTGSKAKTTPQAKSGWSDKADELEDCAALLDGVRTILEDAIQDDGEHAGALGVARAVVDRMNGDLSEIAATLRAA